MTTAVEQVGSSRSRTSAVALAPSPAPRCDECVFRIPNVAMQGGWCACASADRRWQQVAAGRAGCVDFAGYGEDGLPSVRTPTRL